MRSLLILAVAAVAGCSSGTTPPANDTAPDTLPPVATGDLCVSSDCGEVVELVDIPDAENILFAEDGRLFVSGGQNVYEIARDDAGTYTATPLSAATCNFTGMTITRGHLYASCSDSRFFAAKYGPTIALTEIYRFDGMCIPNGTATGPDGRIYVVDEPLNCAEADPKIVALTLDPNDPMRVLAQDLWLQGAPIGTMYAGQGNVMRFPNGLVRDGNTFYSTDGGTVFSVGVGDDGSAGEIVPLFFESTAHDDLALAGPDGLLVTDFFRGRILLLSRDGELLQETLPGTFSEPSSVRLGRPPLFQSTDILVTDKGVIGEESAPIDKLYLFRRKPG
ncbi:MAG TPA: hypothetical protein VM240_13950 [Verrucomicrobiae bacterium]|nr:hypothetical protein [Verrucomicrobiae bacterium]